MGYLAVIYPQIIIVHRGGGGETITSNVLLKTPMIDPEREKYTERDPDENRFSTLVTYWVTAQH